MECPVPWEYFYREKVRGRKLHGICIVVSQAVNVTNHKWP